jgi:hypothetical protein
MKNFVNNGGTNILKLITISITIYFTISFLNLTLSSNSNQLSVPVTIAKCSSSNLSEQILMLIYKCFLAFFFGGIIGLNKKLSKLGVI